MFGGFAIKDDRYFDHIMEHHIGNNYSLSTFVWVHRMPKKLAFHCAVRVGNDIYIHGGFEYPNITNRETFVLHTWDKSWEIIPGQPDCGTPPSNFMTTCAIWNNHSIVVPTFDIETRKTCTAIFNVEMKMWSKLKVDHRYRLLVGGKLGSYVYKFSFYHADYEIFSITSA